MGNDIPFGPVLTNVASIDRLCQYMAVGKFTSLKIIPSWGVEGGWTFQRIRLVSEMTNNLVVRTGRDSGGDPSLTDATWFIDPEAAINELRPFAKAIVGDWWLEGGNEPDVIMERLGNDEGLIWSYRYFFDEFLKRARKEFPRAKIIGPSPRLQHPMAFRWLEIMADKLRECDAVSVHCYAFRDLLAPDTADLGEWVSRAVPWYKQLGLNRAIAITECGINGPEIPKPTKFKRTRNFASRLPKNVVLANYFHIKEDQPDAYHIGLDDLRAAMQ